MVDSVASRYWPTRFPRFWQHAGPKMMKIHKPLFRLLLVEKSGLIRIGWRRFIPIFWS